MRLYRNHRCTDADSSLGFQWFATRKDALIAAAESPDLYGSARSEVAQLIELPIDNKADIVHLLNQYADHPDNG